ncbi:MAG: hypothetical protein GC200_07110 [Tepidisphaera sp.]|nr:hypothetical protein [Tepidisphaera sp.]
MNRPTPTFKPARLALLACLPLLSGCTLGGSTSASAENDRLRREAIDLKDQIAKLKGETDELKAKLAAASKAEGMKPDVIEALPVVTHIEIGGFSGLIPPMGAASGVRVEFYPKDGRDRFVQCVGAVKIEALLLPAEVGQGEPKRLGAISLDPPALRDAYRAGMLGTYYEAVVPIPPDMADAARESSILVRLEFIDGTNDQTHKAEYTIAPR